MRGVIACVLFSTACAFGADFSAGLKAYEAGDYVRARQEWEPLAESGDAPSQFNLGLMYVDGRGVPQNYREAARWFERAAAQGYTAAQNNLGAMYGIGQGVKRDYVQAYKWLSLCAATGSQGCTTQRDLVAKKLKPNQLTEAQRLAHDFKPVKEPNGEAARSR